MSHNHVVYLLCETMYCNGSSVIYILGLGGVIEFVCCLEFPVFAHYFHVDAQMLLKGDGKLPQLL